MATTTNYSWTTPDDTALVKDGASAIRSLGTAIDTTTKNLNPSTTLGDIEYRSSTANTNTRLGIGSTGQVLTVAAGVPSWATPSSLPSQTGNSGKYLTTDGSSASWATIATAKVLQVVQSVYSTVTTIATGTFTDTGLTATITPSSASSKILVTISQPIFNQVNAGSNVQIGAFAKILRGATTIWPSTTVDVQYIYIQSNTAYKELSGVWSYTYLDSPATTSATTYKTQLAMDGGTTMNTNTGGSTITLMEIGA
jgi:hypothetical protein